MTSSINQRENVVIICVVLTVIIRCKLKKSFLKNKGGVKCLRKSINYYIIKATTHMSVT